MGKTETSSALMATTLRNGFSKEQLQDADYEAIMMAYGQDPKAVSKPESKTGLNEAVDTDVKLRGGLRYASPQLNGHRDPKPIKIAVAPSDSADSAPRDGVMPVAIVGMSCRFPGGASDIEKFSEMASKGQSAWSKIPESRFNVDAFYHSHSDRTDSVSSRAPFVSAQRTND